MARVTVDISVIMSSDRWAHPRHVVVKDPNTIYIFGIDNSVKDFSYWKSSNRGQTWTAAITCSDGLSASTSCSIYYEKWNGPSGRNIVHLLRFKDAGTRGLYYRQLDLTTDTLSSEVFVQSHTGAPVSRCTIACSRDLSLIMAHGGAWGDGAISSHKSTDDGATWSNSASIQIAAGFTEYEMWPDFASSDPQDMSVIMWINSSSNDFVLRRVDVSANSVSQTNISTTNTASGINTDWSATLAPNGDIYLAFWDKNAADATSNELKTYRISGSTVTATTSILTATTYGYGVALTTITGYGVVAHYRRDAGAASAGSQEVYYKISTDGMLTWGSEQTYDSNASAAGMVLAPPVIPGGEVSIAAWIDGTDTTKNLFSAYPPVIDTTPTPPVTGTIPPVDSTPGPTGVELGSPGAIPLILDTNPNDSASESDQTIDSNPSDAELIDSNPSDDAGLFV